MNQTLEHLLGPHKPTIIAAARGLLHASAAGGVAFEILGMEPRHVVVLGAESEIGRPLEAPAREPMLGGRRKEDVRPATPLDWSEPGETRRWTILGHQRGPWPGEQHGPRIPARGRKTRARRRAGAGPVLARIAELEALLIAKNETKED